MMIKSILVPVDFSKHSRHAVEVAKAMAERFDAKLQLLHVIEIKTLPTFYGPFAVVDVARNLRGHSMEALETLAKEAAGPRVPVECHVADGHAPHVIADFAEEHDTDLIVVPTHGLTGIERILLGSTAAQLVRMAPCPVLTIKSFGKTLGVPHSEIEAKAS